MSDYVRNLYKWGSSMAAALFILITTLRSKVTRTNDNWPFLVECTPFTPVKQTFCPPEVQKHCIQNDSKAVNHVEYDACSGHTKFWSINGNGKCIEKKSKKKNCKPDERNRLSFRFAPLRKKKIKWLKDIHQREP